jgi:hypothetical protein
VFAADGRSVEREHNAPHVLIHLHRVIMAGFGVRDLDQVALEIYLLPEAIKLIAFAHVFGWWAGEKDWKADSHAGLRRSCPGALSAFGGELIAMTSHSEKMARVLRIFFQFLPQQAHVHINSARENGGLIAPDLL